MWDTNMYMICIYKYKQFDRKIRLNVVSSRPFIVDRIFLKIVTLICHFGLRIPTFVSESTSSLHGSLKLWYSHLRSCCYIDIAIFCVCILCIYIYVCVCARARKFLDSWCKLILRNVSIIMGMCYKENMIKFQSIE